MNTLHLLGINERAVEIRSLVEDETAKEFLARRREQPIGLKLCIYVTYKPNGQSENNLRAELDAAAQHLFNEGYLSGDTPAEVTGFSYEITRVSLG